ncbi:hypothetical protein ALC57_18848 [Trachymyrmex cornetzi]|uniref:Uncharacterized protein n=1 Tax=Trachymyrmex cornetzi TaxID=471704 RepID=A0A195D7P9_9HYME|nr:hypothetical protein ALC57_18848 [Trachymyrmex cornetzi]
MTTRNLHFNPPYYGCSNVILANIRRCLLYSGENRRYVRMDILCKYEKQSTKLAVKQIYT